MSISEKIAREVNRKFFERGGNPAILSGLFDEVIASHFIRSEDISRIRSEATRIAVKLRLEILKEARGA